MLAFHLLSAFAAASALVLFSALVFSGRRMTTLEQTRTLFRVAPLGAILISAGIGLVFVFGVILALDSDRFELWDGWVIAGIILWAIFAGVGQRSGAYYTEDPEAGRGRRRRQRGRGARAPARAHRRLAARRDGRALHAHRDRHDLQAGSLSMRADSINIALLVHVLGAMVLVGGLVTAAGAAIIGWRDEGAALRRFSYWTLLAVALPATS